MWILSRTGLSCQKRRVDPSCEGAFGDGLAQALL